MSKTNIIHFIQQHLWWMLLLFIVVLHIPFLDADPDMFLSHSRDAHSDEGLNTIQIRNYVNHGYLDPWECDNLMKNPLFNLLLLLPFKIFGTKWLVARLTVLSFVFLSLLFIGRDRRWRMWIVFSAPIIFLQYHVFQYSHFALAEMMAVTLIILGMYGLAKMWDEKNLKRKLVFLVLGLTCINFSWFSKIQFLYIEVAALVFVFIYLMTELIKQKKITREMLWVKLVTIFTIAILGLIYYQFWYLKYQEPYEYIMADQAGNRFSMNRYFYLVMKENWNRYFTTLFVKPVWIGYIISIPLGLYILFKSGNLLYKRIFLFSLIWSFVEIHKLDILHVPSRYLVSGYVAMLMVTGTTIFGLCSLTMEKAERRYRNLYRIGLLGGCIIVGTHLLNYSQAYGRRTYRIQEINQYLQFHEKPGMVVIGPWASTATWGTKIRAFPVWKDFLNFRDIKNRYHPDIILSEPGERDSNQAFCDDGYDIEAEADSILKTMIGKWPVNIYWMKK